jgi:hypothetical protein
VNVTLQPVRIGNDYDEDGCLVFADNRLAAVLVRLSQYHGELAGQWFYENGYGRLDGPEHPVFADLDAAQAYIARRLEQSGTKLVRS